MCSIVAQKNRHEKVAALIHRTRVFRVESELDRNSVFRLRYVCYLREGAIAPNAEGMLRDKFDEMDCHLFGVRLDGHLVASIRLHVLASVDANSPTALSFNDHVQPKLAANKLLMDSTRFVVDSTASRTFPLLHYAVLRIPFLAADHFGIDYALAAVRTEHEAFYKRTLGYENIASPRPYLQLNKPLSLMIADYKASRDDVLARHPYFFSNRSESVSLFKGP